MRPYIVNLTSHLIRKHHYDERRYRDDEAFVKQVHLELEAKDVHDMSPETLGKIMCAFENGDVLTSREKLCNNIYFAGNCEEMLRDLVSLCLAYAIQGRLVGTGLVPRYERKIPNSGAKRVIDDHAERMEDFYMGEGFVGSTFPPG